VQFSSVCDGHMHSGLPWQLRSLGSLTMVQNAR
jgi:hypothetical protein